jgi:hypothetical protein
LIDSARDALQDSMMLSNVGGYERIYPVLFRAQVLSELEEGIGSRVKSSNKDRLNKMWLERLNASNFHPMMWLSSMAIHEMQITPHMEAHAEFHIEDHYPWIRFLQRSLKQGHHQIAHSVLLRLMGRKESLSCEEDLRQLNGDPRLAYCYIKV